MGADAISVIRPALDELANAVGATASDDQREWCLTVSLPGAESTAWVQVMLGTLNAAYPSNDLPDARVTAALGDLARPLELIDWQPEVYATFHFDFDDVGVTELARIVDRYFIAILGEE